LNLFLQVLTQNILPILLVASFGYLARRRFANLHASTLSQIVFNVLSPCLVFSSLAGSRLPADELLELVVFAALSILVMGGLAYLLGRLLRLERVAMTTLLLVVMFANSGNYGLTLLQLRYGDDGLSRGVVYYVVSTIMVYTLGIFIASLGQANRRQTFRHMARLPAVYAAVLAIVVYSVGITIPAPLMRAIDIAGAGAIPVMLLVLGMQLAELHPDDDGGYVWPAIGLRLIGGPLVGVALAALLGLRGLSRGAMIVESAMPTAVINIILASEFGLPASTVARIVVYSTLISPLTIAATITILSL
jgi:predicted permease